MEKYVYDFTKILTRYELIEELENINYEVPKKEDILVNYNLLAKEINLDEIETTLRVSTFHKDIKPILSLFDFSVLTADFASQDYEKNRNKLFELLKWNNIDINSDYLTEFADTIELIKGSTEIINSINKNRIDKETLEIILRKYSIEINNQTLSNILILINNMSYQQAIYLPIIRSKYYDEKNSIFYKITVDTSKDNSTNLKSFNGEIFEKLEFKTDEEAKEYQVEHSIDGQLDKEITTYIHFKGEETNDNWSKEMSIVKQRNSIVIMYGELFILSSENNNSITSSEIEKIITELKNKTPNNEFLKYVVRELKSLRKVLGQRTYIKKNEIIDEENMKTILSIINDKEYGDDKSINFKCKIISPIPLQIIEQKTFIK